MVWPRRSQRQDSRGIWSCFLGPLLASTQMGASTQDFVLFWFSRLEIWTQVVLGCALLESTGEGSFQSPLVSGGSWPSVATVASPQCLPASSMAFSLCICVSVPQFPLLNSTPVALD